MGVKKIVKKAAKEARETAKQAFHDPFVHTMTKAYFDEYDQFILLFFSDFLGIPNPLSYHSIELFALLGEELDGWTRRMEDRKAKVDACWCC